MKLSSISAVVLALTVGCATTQAPERVTVRVLTPVSMGLVSYGGAVAAKADAAALHKYLSDKLGRNVSTRVFSTEDELATAIAGGNVDLAWMPPFAFVKARRQGKITAIVKVVRHGLPFYRSVIFVKATSSAQSLSDLKGDSMAWVARTSAAGYLFPWAILVKAGLEPGTFLKQEKFLGDHAAVCKAVLDGEADVGATYADDRSGEPIQVDGCIQAVGDAAKSLRIIATSPPIPNDVLVARPGFSAADITNIAATLRALGPGADDPKLLAVFKADSFTDVGEDDFDPVAYAADVSSK